MSGVLIDARTLQGPDARRGIGRYTAGILGGLAEVGFEFSVLADADLPPPSLPAAVTRVHTTRRRFHGRLAGFEDAVALGDDLRRIRPDLFHSVSLTLPGRSPCPVAITVHDLIPWAFGGWRMAGQRLRHRAAKRLLPRAELVFAVSEATAADLRRLSSVPEDRIHVVPEGVDRLFRSRPGAAARVAERWGQRTPYFIYVGALDVRKNPSGLLQAWAAARAEGAEFDLLIAGDQGRQAPAAMGAARILGEVDDDGLADLYAAAACLLFPSLYEGFGLPPLEAMACGCPVTAFRVSSLPEVVGDAGVLVPNHDAAAMGRAAAALAVDPAKREAAVAAGLERSATFTWERAARATIAGYRLLLG